MGNSEGIGQIEGKKRAVGYLAEAHNANPDPEDLLFDEEGEVVRVDKSPKLLRTRKIPVNTAEEAKIEEKTQSKDYKKVQSIDISQRKGLISASVSRKTTPNVSLSPSPRVNLPKSQLNLRSKPPIYRLKQRLEGFEPASAQFTVVSPHRPFLQDSRPQKPSKSRIIVQSSYKLLPAKADFLSLSVSSSGESHTLDQIKDKRCHKGVISLSPSKKVVSKSFLSAYIPDLSRGTGSIHIKRRKQVLATSEPVSPRTNCPPKGSRAERVWVWKGSHGQLRPRKKGKEGQ